MIKIITTMIIFMVIIMTMFIMTIMFIITFIISNQSSVDDMAAVARGDGQTRSLSLFI